MIRPRHRGEDDGFILPYMLLVIMLIMAGTATMLATVANNIVPARASQDQEAATSLAQAGIQVYVAELNAHCSNYYQYTSGYSVQECSWPASYTKTTPLTSGNAGAPATSTGTYQVYATNYSGFLNKNNDDLRIVSTGKSGQHKVTLVADVSGVPNLLRFAYFTDRESVSPAFLASYYPSRTISVANGSGSLITALQSLLGLSTSSTVSWPGVTTANAATCGNLWYTAGSATGRGVAGDSVAESSTSTTSALNSQALTHSCSVDFSYGMNFNGPVYSQDAFLLSDGVTSSGVTSTGPNFSVPTPCNTTTQLTTCENLPPASTAWSTSATPATSSAAPYRSVTLGGTPTTNNSGLAPVQISPFNVALPTSISDAAQYATCTYPASTTFTVSGSTVTASSTGTPIASCPTAVAISKTTLYVNGTATINAGGSLTSGELSIAATGDIVLNGSLTTSAHVPTTLNEYGEHAVSNGVPAIDLIAQGSVRMAHTVTCASGSPSSGYCANDITGLYATSQAGGVVNADGTLKSTHPARQYCNSSGNAYPCTGGTASTCDSSSTNTEIDAAVIALTGSFQTDNYNRGCSLGTVTVDGGVYTYYRGPLGQEWEVPSAGATARSYSGYKLQINYVSLERAGLPYVPALQGVDNRTLNGLASTSAWHVLSVSGAAS
ncbi:hypothetical protein [Jatrophihabitans sp.]|uniref:hypothetical protein n=1 Tax=Jatrophihabitans sp. TaxID=1932789 RepID=UPI0030C6C44B|nr:hypothetical protein [Jatrophihabitans sp.]